MLTAVTDFQQTYLENQEERKHMAAKLTGKVALITGASAGIGQACARALAQEGAHLVLTARRQERLDQLKREAEKAGTEAISVIGDAREESTAIKTVEAATQAFGRIDILINNTGWATTRTSSTPALRSSMTSWTPTFAQRFCSPGTRSR